MSKTNQHLILSDNRVLCFAEYGEPDGFPIVYCHGSQSSRLEMHYDLSFTKKHNLRIITIDRPGHGHSEFNPKGSVLSFANDVNQLIEFLLIPKFSVVGMSAGSPFALAIAYSYPEKVNKLSIISGFAPFISENKKSLSKEVSFMLCLAKTWPFLLKKMLQIQKKQLNKNPDKALKNFLKIMSAPDQEVLKNEQVMHVIKEMFTEAFRNNSKGVAYEISKLLVQDWKFNLNDIQTPTTLWQGKKDKNVPYKWAEMMHRELPNSNLILKENEGHLIIFNHAEEMFSELK